MRWFAIALAVRKCIVSCTDLQGEDHIVEVTADSLYEAVAQGLRVFRENDWVGDIGHGQTEISVMAAKSPDAIAATKRGINAVFFGQRQF